MKEYIKCSQHKNGIKEFNIRLLVNRDELICGKSLKVTINISSEEFASEGLSLTDLALQFEKYANGYERCDKRMVKSCMKHLKTYAKKHEKDLVTTEAMEDFYEYLTHKLHGSTPANYFKKLRQYMARKVKDGTIDYNYASDVTLHYMIYKEKHALDEKDILKLMNTPCSEW